MDFMLNLDLKKLPRPITYRDKLLLVGSCFTEHIGRALQELKFNVHQNPNGILFDPVSVCRSLVSYTTSRQFGENDLIQLNEIWHSWEHHSRFSHINKAEAIKAMNDAHMVANQFLKQANWVIITLGSAFSYQLTEQAGAAKLNAKQGVANCHRAPAQWFNKVLLETGRINELLEECYVELKRFNPAINFLLTVSPVRHVRDGVIENNRSKARLIEAVHHLVEKFDSVYYFPAYELVIDVLRDYRFYDIDMAHPNYMATEFVLQKFASTCIDEDAHELMQEIRKINTARKHKPLQPNTDAHRQFLQSHFEKTKNLQEKFPYINLEDEMDYFSK